MEAIQKAFVRFVNMTKFVLNPNLEDSYKQMKTIR